MTGIMLGPLLITIRIDTTRIPGREKHVQEVAKPFSLLLYGPYPP